MIAFQTSYGYEIDLTPYQLSLNEESNFFMNNLIKSWSFPFPMQLYDELAKELGLPDVNDVVDFDEKILGNLIIDNDYYEATLRLGDAKENYIDAQIYYGDEVLAVYDTELKNLPWPLYIENNSQEVANRYLDALWPAVTHNFPKVYRPELRDNSDYENFERFVNNYSGSDFVQNTTEGVQPDVTFLNKNVLSPCPYLLELLTFGYRVEGKAVRGKVITDERLKRLLYVPENFIEKYQGSQFLDFEFDVPDRNESINGVALGVYENILTPQNQGNYNLKINLNLDPIVASYFSLRVFIKNSLDETETELFAFQSQGSRVNISETLNINITSAVLFHPLHVEMKLPYNTNSIADFNAFQYAFKEGRLNRLIGSYSLADYVPDMTFGEFVNTIKNWLNLDIVVGEDYVEINFVEDVVKDLPEYDHSHLEVQYPGRKKNTNRVFKLLYADGSEAIIDNTGQIYSDVEKESEDIITIKSNLQMAVVEQNYDVITAKYQDPKGMLFCIYDGLQGSANNCLDNYLGFFARPDDVYREFWSDWMAIRTNNFTYTDSFEAHSIEELGLRSKYYKYNKLLLPVKISKKRNNNEYWQVEREAESI